MIREAAFSGKRAQIGFVLQPQKSGHISIRVSFQNVYINSSLSQIGFVFSNCTLSNTPVPANIHSPVIPAQAGIQDSER